MNVGIIFFSYRGDKALLELSLRAVPRLREQGHEVTAYVADDGAAPLSGPLNVPPCGIKYYRTTFDRKGNLNGVECIRGMAEEYEAILRKTGHDWLIKADCDTFINHLRWLDGVDPEATSMVGTIHVETYCSGACYAISRRGAARLPGLLEKKLWQERAERAHCEDRFFWHALRMTGNGDVLARHANGAEISHLRLHHDWQHPGISLAELTEAAAVDFKRCRWHTPAANWESDREQALTRYRAYIEHIENKKNG